ncbi:MAG: hypothetical protein J5836_01275 [Clostridia bacterium]|nr:hypothetical protein [Clostridia bacterium]
MNIKVTLQDFLNTLKEAVEKVKEKSPKETGDAKDALKAELEEIEQAYKNSPYMTFNGTKVPKLNEISYSPASDEEIAKTAEEEVKAERAEKEKKLKNTAEEKIAALGERKTEAEKNAAGYAAKISESTKEAKQEAENQALKRGIGRSSIIAEELAGLDEAAVKALGEVYSSLGSEIAKIDSSISSLKTELTDALDSLDGETAVKINEKIKSLQAERDKKQEEVTKYNNSLRASSAEQLKKLGIENAAEEDSEEYVKQNADKIRKLYAYYYSLGDGAKKELKNDKEFIEKYVGSSGYSYLNNLLNK